MTREVALQAGQGVAERYLDVRSRTLELCQTLAVEDYCIQTTADVSPTKWHLGHTSWFYETFLLEAAAPDYEPFHPRYHFLFNSYYNSIGQQHARPERGLLSRPTVEEVRRYRNCIDERMQEFLKEIQTRPDENQLFVTELGRHHEQQHQELMLTDIQHVFSVNPLRPAFREGKSHRATKIPPLAWIEYPGGMCWMGHVGKGFAFDNETPRHQVLLKPFQLASRPVTNSEYLVFMKDDGYERADLWLSDGWDVIRRNRWDAPLYWERSESGGWWRMTLSGMQPVDPAAPVTHVSYYEADAFARWAGFRLPTEQEWEVAAQGCPMEGNFVESGALQPVSSAQGSNGKLPLQMFGDVWEWTASPHVAYPGFRPLAGSIGEYNGKFMCNQMVLRGGSCVTPLSHIRATYRNFFHPDKRWQFTGIRLAQEA